MLVDFVTVVKSRYKRIFLKILNKEVVNIEFCVMLDQALWPVFIKNRFLSLFLFLKRYREKELR